jgi:HlyD family secretion protein
VRPGQAAKLKLAAFQFQKYGMLDGRVLRVNADATEAPSPNVRHEVGRERPVGALAFRALIELDHQNHFSYPLQPGMQVAGEIHLGTRSVLEYLLSPVQKAFHEAARER